MKPATILAWFRALNARKYDSSAARKLGRPQKAPDISKLVLDIAQANPGWGYTKIRDALRTEDAPDSLYACDFFSVEVLGISGTVRLMVFFVIQIKTRAVQIAGTRVAPDGEWMKQVARNLASASSGSRLLVP